MKNKYLFGVYLLLSLSFVPQIVKASSITVLPQSVAVGVGQELRLDVVVDSGNQPINAVSGIIILPEGVEAVRIEDGWSIIGIWVTKPEPGMEIPFSGIIPNGLNGAGAIFSIYVTGEAEGVRNVDVRDAEILLNDGKATETEVISTNTTFSVVKRLAVTLPEVPGDETPPQAFIPRIAQSDDLFDGRYFVMFNTLDPGAGIDRYEIFETSRELSESQILSARNARWKEVSNPAPLSDQKLESYIYIKATDRAGNSQVAFLPPVNSGGSQFTDGFSGLLGILVLIGVVLIVVFFVRRTRKK